MVVAAQTSAQTLVNKALFRARLAVWEAYGRARLGGKWLIYAVLAGEAELMAGLEPKRTRVGIVMP